MINLYRIGFAENDPADEEATITIKIKDNRIGTERLLAVNHDCRSKLTRLDCYLLCMYAYVVVFIGPDSESRAVGCSTIARIC